MPPCSCPPAPPCCATSFPARPPAPGPWDPRRAAGGLGVALGPAVGGPLTDTLGWRSVIWINLPVGAVALLIALWSLPHPPLRPRGRHCGGKLPPRPVPMRPPRSSTRRGRWAVWSGWPRRVPC
ncbi:MFS transporter [Streptomyces syringium]|uniref:MFS transporter n=1 Tax=Streptomyces syringium TaxID=76729 RepID=UPI003455D63A